MCEPGLAGRVAECDPMHVVAWPFPLSYTRVSITTERNGVDGETRGQSQQQRVGDGGNPARDASKLTPEPPGRTDRRTFADDLRDSRNK